MIFDRNLIRSILLSYNNIRARAIIFDACDSCLYILFARIDNYMCDELFCHASAVTFCDMYDGRVRNLLAAINGSGSC